MALSAALMLPLSGCFLFEPYEIQIQQGNIITAQMIQSLKPGMTKQQVVFILGSPNVVDPMHPDEWYYVYTDKKDHLPTVQKHLTVYFKAGVLDHMDGDYPPPQALELLPTANKVKTS